MDLGGGNLDQTTTYVIPSEALLGVNMDHGGQIWTPTNKHRTSFQRRHDEMPELTTVQ